MSMKKSKWKSKKQQQQMKKRLRKGVHNLPEFQVVAKVWEQISSRWISRKYQTFIIQKISKIQRILSSKKHHYSVTQTHQLTRISHITITYLIIIYHLKATTTTLSQSPQVLHSQIINRIYLISVSSKVSHWFVYNFMIILQSQWKWIF